MTKEKEIVLTREAIKDYNDIKIQKVFVNEWDGVVYVKTLTASQRDQWEYDNFVKGNEKNLGNKEKMTEGATKSLKQIRASLIILTATDAEGNPLFKDEDIEWLTNKNAKAVDRIYEVAQKINGMRKEDIEEVTKN